MSAPRRAKGALGPAARLAPGVLALVAPCAWSATGEEPHGEPLAAARPVAQMPLPVTSFGAAECGGWVYVLGGYFGTPHRYDAEGQSRSFARWNLADGASWEELPGTEGLQGLALVAHGGALYRVGGSRILNGSGEETRMESVADFARFDPTAREWTALAPLPEGRSSHDASVVGSTLFVAGGWRQTLDGEEPSWPSTLLALDLEEEGAAWRELELPAPRRALAAASAGGTLVLLGGLTPEGETTARVDRFDPASGEWSREPDFPGEAFAAAAVGVGERVYASGRDGIVLELAPGEGEWRPVARLAFPRMFHRFVAVSDDELIALGGISGMTRDGRTRHVESVPLSREAAERADPWAVFTLPSPGRARNRQAIFLRGDTLYAFGGNQSRGQHDFEPDDFLREGFRVHLPSLACSPLAPLPEPRQSMPTLVTADEATGLALGGFGHDGEVARTLADTFAYDFRSDLWSRVEGALERPRTQHALLEHEGELWILGGLDYDPRRAREERFQLPLEVLRSPATADEWRFAPTGLALPRPRRAFGGAVLDGKAYLVGGMREDFEPVEECDVLDLESGAWERIPAPRRVRVSPELVALGGRLYLVGGSSRSEADAPLEPDPSIEVFDPRGGSWSVVVEELPFEPVHLRAFPYEGRLLLYTAHDAERDVLRFALLDVEAAARTRATADDGS